VTLAGLLSPPGLAVLRRGVSAESSVWFVLAVHRAKAMKNVVRVTVIWGSSRKSFSAGGG